MSAIDPEKIIAIPGIVRREHGWTGAKLRGAVKIIEERLRETLLPSIDPDLIEARQVAATFTNNRKDFPAAIMAGKYDESEAVTAILAAIKRGRELASSSTFNDADNQREGDRG